MEAEIVLANMTRGEKWLNQIYEGIYRLKTSSYWPDAEVVMAQPFLEADWI